MDISTLLSRNIHDDIFSVGLNIETCFPDMN